MFLCLAFGVSCSNHRLVSIAVTPAAATVTGTGQTIQFEALGTTNDTNLPASSLGSAVTWSSSATSVATISSSGLATAVGCGTTTISAQDGGIVGQTSFTNTCAGSGGTPVLQSITLTPSSPTIPAIGQTSQFVATGVYANPASTADITALATWQSSNVSIATVNDAGLATAVTCGTTTIIAEYQGVLSQTQLTVSCTQSNPVLQSINLYPSNPTIPQLGQTTQFIALGVYSPPSTNNNFTNLATWASSDSSIATINSAGLATAVGCGATTITAQYQGVIGQMQLTVSCTVAQTPVLQSISLYPGNPSIQLGQTTQFIALAVYSPPSGNNVLTNIATWASSDAAVATVGTNTGLATAVSCGTTTITAQYAPPGAAAVIGQTQLTVPCTGNQPLQSISVLPSSPSVPEIGQTTQFLALGTLLGGAQEDLTSSATWSSSNPQIATVENTGTNMTAGMATTYGCGTTTISASFTPAGGTPIVGTTVLTVSCNSIASVELIVVKMGAAAGTVISAPAGIDCGPVCGGLFNEGTGFVLTPTTGGTWSPGSCDQVIGGACYFTLVPDASTPSLKTVTITF